MASKLASLSQRIEQLEAETEHLRAQDPTAKRRRADITGQLERLRAEQAVVARKRTKLTPSSDREVLTFQVSRVYKGAVGERLEIVTR